MTEQLIDDEELWQLLANTNKPEYNVLKTCEELTELQEKLLKFHLKVPEKKPKMEEIVDEIGDVIIRIGVLMSQYDLVEMVTERLATKSNKLYSFYQEGKYKGGI